MTSMTRDLACFVKDLHKQLRGMIDIHVDDWIWTEGPDFIYKSKLTKNVLNVKNGSTII